MNEIRHIYKLLLLIIDWYKKKISVNLNYLCMKLIDMVFAHSCRHSGQTADKSNAVRPRYLTRSCKNLITLFITFISERKKNFCNYAGIYKIECYHFEF